MAIAVRALSTLILSEAKNLWFLPFSMGRADTRSFRASHWMLNHGHRLLSPAAMLKPHEIFARMAPGVAAQLFTYLFDNEKPLYKATIDTLAKQRKLRPVFVERKPRDQRHAWLQETLGKKQNESIAAHLLQIWLVGAHAKLLCDFLDGLGIEHDENGTIENLPAAPAKADLAPVIDSLLAAHEPGIVAVYLHAFQASDETGWSTLAELLAEDDRLALAPITA